MSSAREDHYANIPTIIETEGGKYQAMDIWTSLMKDRILVISGGIDDSVANIICPALLILERQDPEKEIRIFINSHGGIISAGLAIIDTMRFIQPDIRIICQGMAASMAAVILSCGTKGKRFMMPLARCMIHEPWVGNYGGRTTDLLIEAKEMEKTRHILTKILAEQCEKDQSQLLKDCERDKYMSAEETVAYGLVDGITTRSKATKED